ncbi:MAG: nicotinate phosphoribosyltransferase [Candidatus Omnitrophica bacterium]|nr:nicotinate phosphoribosyltransferase [Candidatus Omnitrophota bacterium]
MTVSALLMDFYELTMCAVYFAYKPQAWATFDLFVRKLPEDRSFLVACGIKEALLYLKNFSFAREDIKYLKKFNFRPAFLNYLAGLKFTGDVWAVKEGTIVFEQEPIMRITAPLCQAQLVESVLLNTINLQTAIASKAARIILAAEGRAVYDFSLRRAQGQDAALKAAKASYIAGAAGSSNVLAGKMFGIPTIGTMAHSYVMSFDTEMESFQAYADIFPKQSILLLDTYSYKKGIKNAITIARRLKRKRFNLSGVRLDSGDLARESKRIRKVLDENGFGKVKIVASGDLDEYKIKRLIKIGAPLDSFGVGTKMGVSVDAPYCDVIYKISEITDKQGGFVPTMKLSQHKNTLPGRKQVFRIRDKKGTYKKDIIALETEKIKGIPLLLKMLEKGRIVYDDFSLKTARKFVSRQLKSMPHRIKDLGKGVSFPVEQSVKLKSLAHKIGRGILGPDCCAGGKHS